LQLIEQELPMATIIRTIDIDAPADEVWDASRTSAPSTSGSRRASSPTSN
jgi:hypothetical protein